MKYRNAVEILPDYLVQEIQMYLDGDILYIPKASTKKHWGADSGARIYYQKRNQAIRKLYFEGHSIDKLSKEYGLAESTIKKIIYS